MTDPDNAPLCLATAHNDAGHTFHLFERIDGAWLAAVAEERRERQLAHDLEAR